MFCHHCALALRSKVGVKVKGQGYGSRSRVTVKVKFLVRRAKKSHHSNVFVCVSNNLADAVDQLLIFGIWVGIADQGSRSRS